MNLEGQLGFVGSARCYGCGNQFQLPADLYESRKQKEVLCIHCQEPDHSDAPQAQNLWRLQSKSRRKR